MLCYHIYVIMHVKDSQQFLVRVGQCVPVAGFSLFLYSIPVMIVHGQDIKTLSPLYSETCISENLDYWAIEIRLLALCKMVGQVVRPNFWLIMI